MYIDLSKQPLPPVYRRNNQDCYLDPIRQKLIYITPEETVRQRVLSYLIYDRVVPQKMLQVEEPLSHYGVHTKIRADIVVKCYSKEGNLIPLAVIECKAPGVGLGEQVANQLFTYADTLGCDYAMMINDMEFVCYYYDQTRQQYFILEELPQYSRMLDEQYRFYEPEPVPDRIPFDRISSHLKETLDEDSTDIGCHTPHPLACAAFNLSEGLLDHRHKFPKGQYKLFKMIEDYGVRILSYGNSSGGVFYGPYRSMLLDINGTTEIVSFSVSPYQTYSNLDTYKTALNVAIDNEKNSHHALQLVLDDNILYSKDIFTFYHHGRISIGNKGSGKINELRKFVRERYPIIIDGTRFNLGSMKNDHLWKLDEIDMIKLIENLISYALIRDEYRAYVKKHF